MAIVQVIKKEYDDHNMAVKYYTILFALNNIHLSYKDIQLMAFISNKGYINDKPSREEFCRKYTSTLNTVNQTVTKLKKLGLLSKIDGQLKVIPFLDVDFTSTIILNIKLTNVQ